MTDPINLQELRAIAESVQQRNDNLGELYDQLNADVVLALLDIAEAARAVASLPASVRNSESHERLRDALNRVTSE